MKHIVIDPLDYHSVEKALRDLVAYKRWIKERCDELCRRLATDYALRTVADTYGYTEGGRITCTVEEIENGYRVVAEGTPVFFLEYGTGPAAGTGFILGTPPVSTEPGSYSALHAGTYQDWLDGGGEAELGPYKWTIQPRSGMYFAFKAASENVMKVAKEVFSE